MSAVKQADAKPMQSLKPLLSKLSKSRGGDSQVAEPTEDATENETKTDEPAH